MLERIRKWCAKSYFRYRLCILMDILYIVLILAPLSGFLAIYELLRGLVVDSKHFWNKEAYYKLKEEVGKEDE